jgi:membrane protein implicated in regulation of membrane protease activity
VAGLLIGGLLTWFASRWFRETTLFRRAVLSASVAGGHEIPLRSEPGLPTVGARCHADTDLRPSGRVRVQDELFDAQSTGDYIARGAAVVVIARSGRTLIVEPAREESHES